VRDLQQQVGDERLPDEPPAPQRVYGAVKNTHHKPQRSICAKDGGKGEQAKKKKNEEEQKGGKSASTRGGGGNKRRCRGVKSC